MENDIGNSGIVRIDNSVKIEDLMNNIDNFNPDYHLDIILKVLEGKIVIEKDNSAIRDVLLAFNSIGKYVRECDEVIKDMCIGYCIVPIMM